MSAQISAQIGAGRRSLLLGGLAGLAGCGWRPVYGTYGAAAHPELAAIYVGVLPERQGQLLRQALQRRLEGASSGVAKRYELLPSGLDLSVEGIGIQADSSSNRVRMNASTTWTLRLLDPKQTVVTTGSAKSLDGYNINNEQYFAADMEQSAVIKRLAESIADKIVLDLAAYFRTHPQAA